MGWWTEQVVPRLADASLKGREVGEWREIACERLTGDVLEIGFGSGLNSRWYPGSVTTVHAVEPSDKAWAMSERRRARTSVLVERSGLDGQRLAAADASMDSALSTFTLCTIPDPATALAEIARVLKPGGVLGFVEHGHSPDAGIATWQRRLNGLQKRLAGGCHLTRDVVSLLADAGFAVDVRRQGYLSDAPGFARPWGWLTAGSATRAPR